MKKFILITSAAVGMLTLASCSSDDFEAVQSIEPFDGIVLNVTDGDEAVTRSYKTSSFSTQFEAGDQMRVYDSNLQKYDEFKFKSSYFGLDADPRVGTKDGKLDYQWALFGADEDNLSYAGWNDGNTIALLKIKDTYVYAEGEPVGNKVTYKSTLPMFGVVRNQEASINPSGKSFETTLYTLVARAKVTFENGAGAGVKRVRARALKFNDSKKLSDFTALSMTKNVATAGWNGSAHTDAFSEVATETGAPNLSGWFEAVLDDKITATTKEGGLQKVSSVAVENSSATNKITATVPVASMKDYTNVVFFPIAPGKYDVIVFEYSTLDTDVESGAAATNWKYIGYIAGEIDRTMKFGKDIEGSASDLTITTEINETLTLADGFTSEVTAKIAELNTGHGPVNLTVAADPVLTTYNNTELNTIYIPQLKNDFTIEIASANINTKSLTIAEAAEVDNSESGHKVTIKFTDFTGTPGKNNVVINTPTTDITLTGANYGKVGGTIYRSVIATAKTITLGSGSVNFTSYSGKSIEVNAGDIVLNNMFSDANVINKGENNTITTTQNGAITQISAGGAKEVIINNGTITKLNAQTAKKVTVKGGKVTNLNLAAFALDIVMTNGEITNIKKQTADLESDVSITISTEGNAVIGSVENFTGSGKKVYNYTISSKLTAATTKNDATITDGNIFTAAQLNSITTTPTALQLKADITIDGGTFASKSLAAAFVKFDGENHTISGLKTPLFKDVTSTAEMTIKNLKLTEVAIEATTANVGALANKVTVANNITIQNVTVSGTKIGATYSDAGAAQEVYNVGGLIGQATNTAAKKLLIQNCGVSITEAIQGYYGLGGFIGNVKGADASAMEVEFSAVVADGESANKSNINAFKKTFWAPFSSDENCGKVGNFIGTISGGATSYGVKITIGKTDNNFGTFFDGNNVINNTCTAEYSSANKGWLEFARNISGTTKYQGMENQLFGYSTCTLGSVSIYGLTKVKEGKLSDNSEDEEITLANYINIFK